MDNKKERIISEIKAERENQKNKFSNTFDESNSINDWVCYIIAYLGRVTTAQRNAKENYLESNTQKSMLIKAAALIITTLENLEEVKS